MEGLNLPRPELVCRPPLWARGAHPQTLAGHFLSSEGPEPPWERTRLDLGDGDSLVVRVADGSGPVAVTLLHGVGGSADSDYMRRMSARFHAEGWPVLSVNHRGAGEGRGLAVRPYHAGAVEDLSRVLSLARDRFPGRIHLAVGFSLSANMLLLALGRGDAGLALPDAAIAVNPPTDLERSSRRLIQGFNRAYDLRFVRLLRSEVKARRGPDLRGTWTLREFDARYTAPFAGFRDRDDYYARAACGPHLAGIRVPTVLLTSGDDPFAAAEDLGRFPLSPRVHLHLEPWGGHMGYISRDLPGHRWMDYALLHYARALRDVVAPARP